MELGDLRQRLDAAVHRVAAQRAVHMHVHETRRDETVVRVNDLCVVGPKHLRGGRDLFDLAAFDDDTVMFQHAMRADYATIDNHHHDSRSMARPCRPDKRESFGAATTPSADARICRTHPMVGRKKAQVLHRIAAVLEP